MASQQQEAARPPGDGGKIAITNVRVFDGRQLAPGGTGGSEVQPAGTGK